MAWTPKIDFATKQYVDDQVAGGVGTDPNLIFAASEPGVAEVTLIDTGAVSEDTPTSALIQTATDTIRVPSLDVNGKIDPDKVPNGFYAADISPTEVAILDRSVTGTVTTASVEITPTTGSSYRIPRLDANGRVQPEVVPGVTAAAVSTAASATLTAGAYNPIDATTGNKTRTLPSGVKPGSRLSVAKIDSTANTVTITGSPVILASQFDSAEFIADTAGNSWTVIAGYKTDNSSGAPLKQFELMPCLFYGDSLTGSDMQNTVGARWTDRLVRRVGLVPSNHALSGDLLEDQTLRATNGARILPANYQGLVINACGGNNVLTMPDTTRTRTSHLVSLRSFVGLASAPSRTEFESLIAANSSGSWTTVTDTYSSGGAYAQSPTTGTPWIDVPITVAGDYVIHAITTDGTVTLAPFSVIQNSVTKATIDPNNSHVRNTSTGGGHPTLRALGLGGYLITNVAVGTLRIQRSSGTAALALDCITRVNRTTPPAVIITKPPARGAVALQAALAANVNTIKTEFTEAVTVVDLQDGDDSGTMTGPDNTHPNDLGSIWLADKYQAALRTIPGRQGIWRRA